MEMKELSPELREKAKAVTSPEELLALAETEGLDLSDEDLAAVSGGMYGHSCDSYIHDVHT